jgi:hypothetical protein
LGEGLVLLPREQQLLVEPFVVELKVLKFLVGNTSGQKKHAKKQKNDTLHRYSMKPSSAIHRK